MAYKSLKDYLIISEQNVFVHLFVECNFIPCFSTVWFVSFKNTLNNVGEILSSCLIHLLANACSISLSQYLLQKLMWYKFPVTLIKCIRCPIFSKCFHNILLLTRLTAFLWSINHRRVFRLYSLKGTVKAKRKKIFTFFKMLDLSFWLICIK